MKDSKVSELYDLIEYRWDFNLKNFVKVQTHLYNSPKSLCYGIKKRLEAFGTATKSTRFKVVKNGVKQYSNQFSNKKPKELPFKQSINLPLFS